MGCRGCKKSKEWQPPEVDQQQLLPASLEVLKLAGVGPSAEGAGSLGVEEKQHVSPVPSARIH